MSEIDTGNSDDVASATQSYQHSVQENTSLYTAGVRDEVEEEGGETIDDTLGRGSLRSQSVVEDVVTMPSREPTPLLQAAVSLGGRTESVRSLKSVGSKSTIKSMRTPSVYDQISQPILSPENPYQYPPQGRVPTPQASDSTSYVAEMSIANSRNTKLGYGSNEASVSSPVSGVQVRVSSEIDVEYQPEVVEEEEEEEEESLDDDAAPPMAEVDPMLASCVPGQLFSPYEPAEQQDQEDLHEASLLRTAVLSNGLPPPAAVKKPSKNPSTTKKKKKSQTSPPSPVTSPPNYDTTDYAAGRYYSPPPEEQEEEDHQLNVVTSLACDIWDLVSRKMEVEKARGKNTKAKKDAEMAKRRLAKDEVLQLRAEERATQFYAREKYPDRRFNVNVGAKGRELGKGIGSLWLTESALNYEEAYGVQPVSSPSPMKIAPCGSPQRLTRTTANSSSPIHGMRTIQTTKATLHRTRLTPDSENSIDAVARLRKLKNLSSSTSLLRCPKPSSVSRPTSTANPHHPDWRLSPDGFMLLPNGALYNLGEHPSLRRGFY